MTKSIKGEKSSVFPSGDNNDRIAELCHRASYLFAESKKLFRRRSLRSAQSNSASSKKGFDLFMVMPFKIRIQSNQKACDSGCSKNQTNDYAPILSAAQIQNY
jgi:hypothetical protein